jgi:UDPglucose--hexose-1-phosphate uridylyltransferase
VELRKDPITRSWVVTGDDLEGAPHPGPLCPFCPESPEQPQVVSSMASVTGGTWSARAVVHPSPIYHVEGDPGRRGNGIYDTMRSVGAHEVIVENPRHDRQLWIALDEEVQQFLRLCAHRIHDLKNDHRFKYVSVFKDFGALAGQEFDHPTSQIVATTFVPRRVLYELRAAREHYAQKERCVFCDILSQELQQKQRIIEVQGDYVACCPYASRVPFETWIIPQSHDAHFERNGLSRPGALRDCAALLKRTINRIRSITDSFHLVLHTSPNTLHRSQVLNYWRTIDEDYHWHIEIMPILSSKGKSYNYKEVYFSPVTPETAAMRLREAPTEYRGTSF